MRQFSYYLIDDLHYEQHLVSSFLSIELFLMHFNIWTQLNWKKRGWDSITGCGYKFESFGPTTKEKYSFLFIALLSVMIDTTWKPISSKPIIIRLTISNKFSAWKHLVGVTSITSLYCENTLLGIKAKAFVATSLLLSEKPTILPPS